jgi:hypothetical protein
MRTTVRLDDQLYRDVKTRAAQRGTTVTSVIEEALRRLLEEHTEQRPPPPPLPTHGCGGLKPGVPPIHDSRALQDFLDEGVPLDALR